MRSRTREEESPSPATGAPSADELRLELEEFGVFGGREDGVDLRIRLATPAGIKEGAARARDFESVTPALFVDTALRAAELAMDEYPVRDRSERLLILEAEEVEEIEVRTGSFMAVTVRALRRRGALVATGLRAVHEGRCEDAVRAALDAVIQLLEGQGEAEGEEGEKSRPRPEESYDPFSAWS